MALPFFALNTHFHLPFREHTSKRIFDPLGDHLFEIGRGSTVERLQSCRGAVLGKYKPRLTALGFGAEEVRSKNRFNNQWAKRCVET